MMKLLRWFDVGNGSSQDCNAHGYGVGGSMIGLLTCHPLMSHKVESLETSPRELMAMRKSLQSEINGL